jgi:hypothetical protein
MKAWKHASMNSLMVCSRSVGGLPGDAGVRLDLIQDE